VVDNTIRAKKKQKHIATEWNKKRIKRFYNKRETFLQLLQLFFIAKISFDKVEFAATEGNKINR
jgi:hypothetical protein